MRLKRRSTDEMYWRVAPLCRMNTASESPPSVWPLKGRAVSECSRVCVSEDVLASTRTAVETDVSTIKGAGNGHRLAQAGGPGRGGEGAASSTGFNEGRGVSVPADELLNIVCSGGGGSSLDESSGQGNNDGEFAEHFERNMKYWVRRLVATGE